MSDLRKLIEAVEAGAWSGSLKEVLGALGRIDLTTFPAAYHGSLDAAKALHEALLTKDCHWSLSEDEDAAGGYSATVFFGAWFNAEAEEPARAWLIAILKAYEANQ